MQHIILTTYRPNCLKHSSCLSEPYTCPTRGLFVSRICSGPEYSHALIRIGARWEWATTLGFDWQYLSGKKRFRWPLVRSSFDYLKSA